MDWVEYELIENEFGEDNENTYYSLLLVMTKKKKVL